jgi:hypothetical protein
MSVSLRMRVFHPQVQEPFLRYLREYSAISRCWTTSTSRQSTFEVYINHLRGILRKKCKKCHKVFCFACGEPINDPKTPESTNASNDRDLFHCSNLQGIILGVGLAMLEQLYHDQLQNPLGPENKVRTSKRRKTDPVINTPMILDPDDDDDNYLSPPSQGKKSRLGVGYAGDQKEDVSSHPRVSRD